VANWRMRRSTARLARDAGRPEQVTIIVEARFPWRRAGGVETDDWREFDVWIDNEKVHRFRRSNGRTPFLYRCPASDHGPVIVEFYGGSPPPPRIDVPSQAGSVHVVAIRPATSIGKDFNAIETWVGHERVS
jgi:hypothetical protein